MFRQVANPHINALGTSAGPTSEELKERMLDLVDNKKSAKVLRISDGWRDYAPEDRIGFGGKLWDKHVENRSAEWWSGHYVKQVLGKTAYEGMTTLSFAETESGLVKAHIDAADMILVPGGNTYKTIQGINHQRHLLLDAVFAGKPYMGESAGTIIMGTSVDPASIAPADRLPKSGLQREPSLAMVDAQIIVHGPGSQGGFTGVGGWKAAVTAEVLNIAGTSNQESIDSYIATHVNRVSNTEPYWAGHQEEGFSLLNGEFISHEVSYEPDTVAAVADDELRIAGS